MMKSQTNFFKLVLFQKKNTTNRKQDTGIDITKMVCTKQ